VRGTEVCIVTDLSSADNLPVVVLRVDVSALAADGDVWATAGGVKCAATQSDDNSA
jgi:hypothetical protein